MTRPYSVGVGVLAALALLFFAVRGCGPDRPDPVDRAEADVETRQSATDGAVDTLAGSISDVEDELAALRASVDEFADQVDAAARAADRSGSSAYVAATVDVATAPTDARGYVRLPATQRALCDTYSRASGRDGC